AFELDEAFPDFEYSLSDFEKDLWVNRAHIRNNIRMAGEDKEIYPVYAAAKQDSLQWIFESLANGYTAIFNKLDHLNPIVAHLCDEICSYYPKGARAFVTAFLSPSSLHCFGYHYDEVDVFLVQIHGTKLWSVAKPRIPYPIEGMFKPPIDQNQAGNEYLSAELKPGNVLFIPRGHIHKGLPGDSGSLHLSVGIHPLTVADGLINKIQEYSHLDEHLRSPLCRSEKLISAINKVELTNIGMRDKEKRPRLYLPGSTLESTLTIDNLSEVDALVLSRLEPINYKLLNDFKTIEVIGLLFDYGVRDSGPSKINISAGYYKALQAINENQRFSPTLISTNSGISKSDAISLCGKLLALGLLEFDKC
ncbi:cupin domain-containing protein, partial [Agaribacterium haliotis]|uniref:cupin domain-containing protein n=1 Tax=Agaribacterium haliotis TaxID=2013869 RepID=UPI001EFC49D1